MKKFYGEDIARHVMPLCSGMCFGRGLATHHWIWFVNAFIMLGLQVILVWRHLGINRREIVEQYRRGIHLRDQ